jgi:DNA (cytosine-5)-methyltransferase 1
VARQNDRSLPAFPIWDDIRTFDGRPWRGIVDIVAGGFPCQAYSSASRGRSVADDLWPEMRRVVADVAPRLVFAENVSRRAIDRAGDDLYEMGYEVACVSLSAADLGADHIRQRYWLLAYADVCSELRGPVYAEAPERSRVCRSLWQTKPDEPRVADGLAFGVDRLVATGNGQVRAVAATAFRILAAEHSQRTSPSGSGVTEASTV